MGISVAMGTILLLFYAKQAQTVSEVNLIVDSYDPRSGGSLVPRSTCAFHFLSSSIAHESLGMRLVWRCFQCKSLMYMGLYEMYIT